MCVGVQAAMWPVGSFPARTRKTYQSCDPGLTRAAISEQIVHVVVVSALTLCAGIGASTLVWTDMNEVPTVETPRSSLSSGTPRSSSDVLLHPGSLFHSNFSPCEGGRFSEKHVDRDSRARSVSSQDSFRSTHSHHSQNWLHS